MLDSSKTCAYICGNTNTGATAGTFAYAYWNNTWYDKTTFNNTFNNSIFDITNKNNPIITRLSSTWSTSSWLLDESNLKVVSRNVYKLT